MRVASLLLLVVVAGCGSFPRSVVKDGPLQFERATVKTRTHEPARFSLKLKPDFGLNPMPAMKIGKEWRVEPENVPEKFLVTVSCQHGKFEIDSRSLYDHATGPNIQVAFREHTEEVYRGESLVESRKLEATHDWVNAK